MHWFRKLLLDEQRAAFKRVDDLRDYQTDIIVPYLKDNPYSALFADMGMGKTSAVLTALIELFIERRIRHVLVIAPLRVAVQTWPTEIREWSHTWWASFKVIRADEKHPEILEWQRAAREKERWEELGSPNNAASKAKTLHLLHQKQRLAQTPAMLHIINREAVEWLVSFWGRNWPYDTVIVDESTSFSDHGTKRFKALNKVRPLIKRLHLLSGIPAPEGIQDYFAQMYLLDRGERLGKFITHFRREYMMPREYQPGYDPQNGAEERVAAKIADICLVMREEDYLDRKKAIVIERPIVLDAHELKLYKTMERDFVLALPEVEIEAENGAALAGKLLQMASGAIYDDTHKWHHIHDHKLEEIAQLREEAQGSPLLVAYWHQSSLARLREAFPKAVKMDREGHCVDAWNAGKIDILLIHPRSAGHGLNMQYGPGHTLIWFDNPLPFEDYAQTIKRLDRQGQKKVVRVYHLVTQKTIDAKVLPRLREKDNAQAAVKQYIRELRLRRNRKLLLEQGT